MVTLNVAGIAAGQEGAAGGPPMVSVPPTTPPGRFYVLVVADTGNHIPEYSESTLAALFVEGPIDPSPPPGCATRLAANT